MEHEQTPLLERNLSFLTSCKRQSASRTSYKFLHISYLWFCLSCFFRIPAAICGKLALYPLPRLL